MQNNFILYIIFHYQFLLLMLVTGK